MNLHVSRLMRTKANRREDETFMLPAFQWSFSRALDGAFNIRTDRTIVFRRQPRVTACSDTQEHASIRSVTTPETQTPGHSQAHVSHAQASIHQHGL
ncbi:hypothetical protein QQF64_018184 [Cirrhinus molitorella]|uniref:Uncharacterized protein n=1 Tax=Cirrhinus molitorella TaxID=172907 RepID=A0ABR3LKR8_9TELE